MSRRQESSSSASSTRSADAEPSRLARLSRAVREWLAGSRSIQGAVVLGALLLSLLTAVAVDVISRQYQRYVSAHDQLSQLAPLRALVQLARQTAEHRGLSNAWQSGGDEFAQPRLEKREQVDRALADVVTLVPVATQGVHELGVGWGALRSLQERGRSPARLGFAMHTALIADELALLDELVSRQSLLADAEPQVRLLASAAMWRLPQASELTGQLRGVGAGMLADARVELGDAAGLASMISSSETALRASLAQVRRASEVSPQSTTVLAARVRDVRGAFARAVQLARTAFVLEPAQPVDAAQYFKVFTQAIDAQRELQDAALEILAHRLRTRAEEAAWWLLLSSALGVLLTAWSVTLVGSIISATRRDLRLREAALRQAADSLGFLDALLEAAPDGVLSVDAAGTLVLVNSRIEALFGRARSELLGRPVSLLLPEEVVTLLTSSSEGASSTRSLECLRHDGTSFPAELAISKPELGAKGQSIVIVRDTSERLAIERQLQQSQRMEAIGQLSGGLAHDFNNLLGVIVGNLDLLERDVRANERAANRVRTAQHAATRGSELTKRMLAFARRQVLNPQPTDVNQLLRDLFEMLPRTLGADVRVSKQLAEGLPPVTVDAAGLEGALLNLAINARDAMKGGGELRFKTERVLLDARHPLVSLQEVEPGHYLEVSVSDTGSGIPPELLAKVFVPFFTTKAKGKGTGLGLAMVYGFVKQSKGHISVVSELGRGTTFTLLLPLAEQDVRPVAATPNQSEKWTDEKLLQGTVLVVDDEVDLLEVAVSFCEQLGLTTLHATDGPSALEVAARAPRIDLLLTDVVMPGGLNGVVLASKLRATRPELKVIYCSGFPSSALAERTNLQVDGPLIDKPYRRAAFMSAVCDVLRPQPEQSNHDAA